MFKTIQLTEQPFYSALQLEVNLVLGPAATLLGENTILESILIKLNMSFRGFDPGDWISFYRVTTKGEVAWNYGNIKVKNEEAIFLEYWYQKNNKRC